MQQGPSEHYGYVYRAVTLICVWEEINAPSLLFHADLLCETARLRECTPYARGRESADIICTTSTTMAELVGRNLDERVLRVETGTRWGWSFEDERRINTDETQKKPHMSALVKKESKDKAESLMNSMDFRTIEQMDPAWRMVML